MGSKLHECHYPSRGYVEMRFPLISRPDTARFVCRWSPATQYKYYTWSYMIRIIQRSEENEWVTYHRGLASQRSSLVSFRRFCWDLQFEPLKSSTAPHARSWDFGGELTIWKSVEVDVPLAPTIPVGKVLLSAGLVTSPRCIRRAPMDMTTTIDRASQLEMFT